jgi:hypothetical protein
MPKDGIDTPPDFPEEKEELPAGDALVAAPEKLRVEHLMKNDAATWSLANLEETRLFLRQSRSRSPKGHW